MSFFILCLFAFFAGLVDAIGGGGGLVQIPALFTFASNLPHTTILGVNKLANVCGTGVAAVIYSKQKVIPWRIALIVSALAATCSYLGSKVVALISPDLFRPIVLVLVIIVAVYTFGKKSLGQENQDSKPALLASCLIGAAVGFYDGFFGPGTGSFLIFFFVSTAGFTFLSAAATAKIVNLATNLGAIIYFASHSMILYRLALPMALFNMAGGQVGAKLALSKGSEFIRKVFLMMLTLFILKLVWDEIAAFI